MLARQRITLALAAALVCVLTFRIDVAAEPALKAGQDKTLPAAQPLPAARWRRSLLRSHSKQSETASWLRMLEEKLRRQGEPVLAPFAPVAVSRPRREGEAALQERLPLLIYRSHWGTHAVNRDDGTLDWESLLKWSLDGMSRSSQRMQIINTWMTFYVAAGQQPALGPGIVFENSTVGTLSHDGKFVYVVEDLQVPPPIPHPDSSVAPQLTMFPNAYSLELNDALRHSRLQPFEIATGKLKWELGDPDRNDELSCYVVGPPLPLDGTVYALIRRQGVPSFAALFADPCYGFTTLRACFWKTELVRIDPVQGKLLSRHTLVERLEARFPIWHRLRAAHLVVTKDILICPTDTGAVIGVDRATGQPRWRYDYPEAADEQNAAFRDPPRSMEDLWKTRFPPWSGPWWRMLPWWRYSAPAVHGNSLVFTPSFSTAIHCIDVRDGKMLWQSRRDDDDLYLAGAVADTVLIVGKKKLRGLHLASGKRAWEIPTGMPCGYGAARDGVYYLPLEAEPRGKASEIRAIDVAAGKVTARFRSADDHPVGNLFFFGDHLVSQSIREIATYPLPNIGAAP